MGGDAAFLIIDDTALPKKGKHSVGVAPQYATSLGKNANCQTLVSTTLAQEDVPMMVGLKLFLPESWTSDPARLDQARVPATKRSARTKPQIALKGIDRVRAAGVRFGCMLAEPPRQRLFELGLGEVALAFAAASSKRDLALVSDLFATHGRDGFARAWLAARGVGWAVDLLGSLSLDRL